MPNGPIRGPFSLPSQCRFTIAIAVTVHEVAELLGVANGLRAARA